ncbi:MAG: aminoacyl-tRNA hydrolase [Deltaproteobacteria bacterium]|nr:aminoacyl-tRNA hydrolase [Deltaproteobacteria bacterium]
MKLVLGLGNPGKQYQRTRHNMGFLVVDRVASEQKVPISRKKYRSLIGESQADGERVLLVKPQTFMNRSGDAVRELFRYLRVKTQDLVVIHDDLDLPFGRIRIRSRGGGGGHRGVLSVLEALGEEDFFRVRVGIGRPPAGVDSTEYVLQGFSAAETERLGEVVARAADAVRCLLEEDSQRAMERFNRAD